MRHRKVFRKLSRTSSHRRALMRNLATALVLHDRIETTLPKAKELRPIVERLVTLGKKNTLHARRMAMSYLFAVSRQAEGNANKLSAVHRLFTVIAPRYTERNGGYTRVLRTRKRPGDNAQLAVIQFVEETLVAKSAGKRRRRTVRNAADVSGSEAVEG